MPSKTGLATIN